MDELIERFDLEGISGGNAVFNPEKLEWMNNQHIMRMPDDVLIAHVRPWLERAGLWRRRVRRRAAALADARARPAAAPRQAARRHRRGPRPAACGRWRSTPAAAAKHLTRRDGRAPRRARRRTDAIWRPSTPPASSRPCAAPPSRAASRPARFMQAVRVSLTGRTVSPGLFETIELLGREDSLARIRAGARQPSRPDGRAGPCEPQTSIARRSMSSSWAAASSAAASRATRRAAACASPCSSRTTSAAARPSGSTRLIHGGLRYLEMLDFALVRLDLREREILLRIAPHLVTPLRFLLPFYGTSAFTRLKMRAGHVALRRPQLRPQPRRPPHALGRRRASPPNRASSATGCRAPRPTPMRRPRCPNASASRTSSMRTQAGAAVCNYSRVVAAVVERRPHPRRARPRPDRAARGRGHRPRRRQCLGAVVRSRRWRAAERRAGRVCAPRAASTSPARIRRTTRSRCPRPSTAA